MNIPVTPFLWMMAFLPIFVLLVLMVGFRLGAPVAAPIGLAVTIFIGIVFYKADLWLIAVESAKGLWSALTILIIIWTAVLMYQVGKEANAFIVIKNGMKELLPNELLLLLAMGWIFESFLQGITGFGVPVAVGAPLLIGIGVQPVWAVIIPLLGQSWGNTFGTLGAAWDALTMSAGLTIGSPEYLQTAMYAAVFLWLWNMVIGLLICWFYGKGRGVKKGLPAVMILSMIQGGGELLLSQVNTTIACFVPACISLMAILLLGKSKMYRKTWCIAKSGVMDRKCLEENENAPASGLSLFQAVLPYLLLSGITMVVLTIEPVKSFLGRVSIGFAFPQTSTGYSFVNEAVERFSPITPFTHASMFLLSASVIGLLIYRKKGFITAGGEKKVFVRSLTMIMPSAIAVTGLVIMSKIMASTGQTAVLSNGIAQVLGKAYMILSPFIGMLGSFMTGSNVSSNILFGGFQMTTAQLLEVNTSCVLGAQTAGGSIGSAISPSNIVLGTTTAGILGREGDVLKKTSMVVVSAALIMGVIVVLCEYLV